jgi:hypothetical protein
MTTPDDTTPDTSPDTQADPQTHLDEDPVNRPDTEGGSTPAGPATDT